MLFNILGIVIGCAAIMLLLSLIVTSLVQATQHFLKLRARNLLLGLSDVLATVVPKIADSAVAAARARLLASGVPTANDKSERVIAKAVVTEPVTLRPEKNWERLLDLFVSLERSWITPQQLRESLHEIDASLPDEELAKAENKLNRIEGVLSTRFAGQMRLVAVVWSLVIAFVFQVNALELIRNLASSPAMRTAAEGMSDALLQETPEPLAAPRYEDVSESALRTLAERHPDIAEDMAEVSGAGDSKAEIVDELREALADIPDETRRALIEEYSGLLDDLHAAALKEARDQARSLLPLLAAFDIRPWGRGWGFYASDGALENWAGMLITALALTLGAPFWFNFLKTTVGLRDALKPREKEDGQS